MTNRDRLREIKRLINSVGTDPLKLRMISEQVKNIDVEPPVKIGPKGYEVDVVGKALPITTDELISKIDTCEGYAALILFIKLILHPLMDSSGMVIVSKNELETLRLQCGICKYNPSAHLTVVLEDKK